MAKHKILLVDDHELIIGGIIRLLDDHPKFSIIAHIDDGLEVYNNCRIHEPDIIILDLGLPGVNGLDIIPRLHQRWPKMQILAYTAHNEEIMAIRALAAGATGYVLKTSSRQVLLTALQALSEKKRYIDPALNHEVVQSALSDTSSKHSLLTSRESQILNLIANGSSNRQIALQLCISIKTVETHRLNIMRKLDVHKVTELLNCSRRLGLTI